VLIFIFPGFPELDSYKYYF